MSMGGVKSLNEPQYNKFTKSNTVQTLTSKGKSSKTKIIYE